MPGFLASVVPGLVSAATSAITQGGPKRQYKWNKKAADDANAMNRANTEWMLQQNKDLLKEQRSYDSPESAMARYKAAGLNPNLIYGNAGSSSGPIQVGGQPSVNISAPDASYPDVGASFIRGQMAAAQTELTQARTTESYAGTALKSIQTDIAKTNPMLDPNVYERVAQSMMAVAEAKQAEVTTMWLSHAREKQADGSYGDWFVPGQKKVEAEIDALQQRLGLNTADLSIKNRILQSKEFENAIKELNVKWLQDGDLTPEHIRQGLMLMLSKMLGR